MERKYAFPHPCPNWRPSPRREGEQERDIFKAPKVLKKLAPPVKVRLMIEIRNQGPKARQNKVGS
jgi:hypothetical protein